MLLVSRSCDVDHDIPWCWPKKIQWDQINTYIYHYLPIFDDIWYIFGIYIWYIYIYIYICMCTYIYIIIYIYRYRYQWTSIQKYQPSPAPQELAQSWWHYMRRKAVTPRRQELRSDLKNGWKTENYTQTPWKFAEIAGNLWFAYCSLDNVLTIDIHWISLTRLWKWHFPSEPMEPDSPTTPPGFSRSASPPGLRGALWCYHQRPSPSTPCLWRSFLWISRIFQDPKTIQNPKMYGYFEILNHLFLRCTWKCTCLGSGLGTLFGHHAVTHVSHFEASRDVFSEAQRWWEALDPLQVGHVSGPICLVIYSRSKDIQAV